MLPLPFLRVPSEKGFELFIGDGKSGSMGRTTTPKARHKVLTADIAEIGIREEDMELVSEMDIRVNEQIKAAWGE